MYSELMSQRTKELTIFVWVWITFEKAIDLLCNGLGKSRTKIAIEFIRENAEKVRLYGLENSVPSRTGQGGQSFDKRRIGQRSQHLGGDMAVYHG